MTKNPSLVGPWVRRFLLEHVVAERNLSPNTQYSYRDTFLLLLPFAAQHCHCSVDQLRLEDLTPCLLQAFLGHLADKRHCHPATINQRLATLHGKGRKDRCCPLWSKTVAALQKLVGKRAETESVFLNCNGQPLTRFGLHTVVERCAATARQSMPSLRNKRISPHSIRHTTAMHLLRAGVDINTIRAWLGHVSLQTTHIYVESDLEMKANALAKCQVTLDSHQSRSRAQGQRMTFLHSF